MRILSFLALAVCLFGAPAMAADVKVDAHAEASSVQEHVENMAHDAAHHEDGAKDAHGHHDKHDKVEGLPQLDPTWYASQIFWLFLTFVFMYIPFRFRVLPNLSSVIEQRREKIEGDIITARKLREEAETIHTSYETALTEARNKASALFLRAETKMKEMEKETFEDFYKRASQKIEEAQAEVDEAKAAAMTTVNDVASDVAMSVAEKVAGFKADKKDALSVVENISKKAA